MSRILYIITGSIAAVKAPAVISLFKDKGHEVTCVLTDAAGNFVTPMSLSYLSENRVYTDMFSGFDEDYGMSHINLSRDNDLILVAPCSADFIAKLAGGFCDDLASTICIASDKPLVVAPAMNPQMLRNKAVQRNLATLKQDGVEIIEPVSGRTACGEEGVGRMSEPEDIVQATEKILNKLNKSNLLEGKKILITGGPTREKIDPVRYISNYSSGKQAYALADVMARQGAEITLISGPTNLKAPLGVECILVQSASEMLHECTSKTGFDVVICAAAVADWKARDIAKNKIKKDIKQPQQDYHLDLVANPDILFELSKAGKKRAKLVIGFAAETEHLIENALVKLERKKCDWIVANDVSEGKAFDADENSVAVIDKNGVILELETQDKYDISQKIMELIVSYLDTKNSKKDKIS